ncbi:DUF29 domain-containing protein [Planktothrix agardhii 1806]|nr:DUF29 domain-containing protein [Planktothrix agardhii]MCF3570273.1 DUF29 domain-containing protein [Planktothrix agardhii 1805]MCF3615549.1 DUF29 domain-containing protein [Planktothrix agardhii 1806]MCF3620026.1 DUF29 domain-containing protein [Planktothrix agardhii 1030]
MQCYQGAKKLAAAETGLPRSSAIYDNFQKSRG